LKNDFFYWIFFGGFIGGKLFFWLERPSFYYNNPQYLLYWTEGGFVFFGSLIVGFFVSIVYLRMNKKPIIEILDIMVLAILIAHSFGRLGCFLGGCCYGIHTDSILGVDFEAAKVVNVFPLQLLEATCLAVFFIFLHYFKKQYAGQKIIYYVLFYSILRFFLEFFRGDVRGFIIPEYFSHGQLISILLFLSTFLVYIKFKNNSISKHNH
jgi:phosphatidylglycerol---prolipoprotein diacylglyceryl transferase